MPPKRKKAAAAARPGGTRTAKSSSRSRKPTPGPSSAPSFQLTAALSALRNNETRVTTEVKLITGKSSMETKVSYPQELLTAFRGMFGAGKTYDFELHYPSTQTSSAAGSLLGSIAFDPGATSWAEWSTLSALFDECKALSSYICFNSTYNATNTALVPMVMAVDEVQTGSGAPSSITAIIRLAGSVTWIMSLGTAGSGRFKQSRKLGSRGWCSTSYPSSVQPMGGFAGRWSFGNSAVFPDSTSIAFVDLRLRAKFRNRA